jgi:glutamate 5-kinase
MAAWSGIPTVVASSTQPDAVQRALAGQEVGTWIAPHQSGLSARKLWIAFGLPPSGEIHVDAGAAKAIREHGRSLLAVGIRETKGSFAAGDAVGVIGPDGSNLAKGLTRMGAEAVRKAAGQHSSQVGGEVIHRDDLVLLV